MSVRTECTERFRCSETLGSLFEEHVKIFQPTEPSGRKTALGMIYVACIRCSRNSYLRVSSHIINTACRVGAYSTAKVFTTGCLPVNRTGFENAQGRNFSGCDMYKTSRKVGFRNPFHVSMVYHVFIPYSLCRKFFCSLFTVVLLCHVTHISEGSVLPCALLERLYKTTRFCYPPPELEPEMLEC